MAWNFVGLLLTLPSVYEYTAGSYALGRFVLARFTCGSQIPFDNCRNDERRALNVNLKTS